MPHMQLPFRSLFLHAWDLADDQADAVMGWMADARLNTMCVAGTYHSGWFIHPHAARHRAFMTEGSVCYFHPQASLYRDTPLKPTVAAICRERDWLAEAGRRLDRFGLRLVSWTIGTHNTRLGRAHPQFTQQNVYGDRLPHALCPANDEVRAYLIALCRDLATNFPMWALQLESFGWMTHAHGHHHERDLVGLMPLEQQLMSLCVCPACTRRAAAAGVDCGVVVEVVRRLLDDAFREAPDRPAGHPATMAELEQQHPALAAYNVWRKRFADSVIADIKRVALAGTSCRLLLQSGYDADLRDIADGFACGAYGLGPADVAATCRRAIDAVPRDWPGVFQCFVRLGNGVPRTESELRGIVDAVRDAGCTGVNFYNRSEAPPKMLAWLASAMRSVATTA